MIFEKSFEEALKKPYEKTIVDKFSLFNPKYIQENSNQEKPNPPSPFYQKE